LSDIAYVRVSSVDQNTARQLADVNVDKVFEDKCSGKDTKRLALTECLEWVREGDVLHVHSIDRLARNLGDLQHLVGVLNDKGVSVHFHKENLQFSGTNDPLQTLMLQMMGAFAEFERSMIRERQREGIRAAQKAGKRIGAKPKLTPEQVAEIRQRAANREQKTSLAEEYGVSRQTIYSVL